MRARVFPSLRAVLFGCCALSAAAGFAQDLEPLPPIEDPAEIVVVPDAAPYTADAGGWFTSWEIARHPAGLLWSPPIASKREPRMALEFSSLGNHADPWTLETWIGGQFGLLRAARPEAEHIFQLDIFGLVQTRLSPEDLTVADYRCGLPLTYRVGASTFKFGFEHTSSHIGDEGLMFAGLRAIHYAKDELVFGADRWLADWVRPYGQVSYALRQDLPDDFASKWRFDVGTEIYDRWTDRLRGTPFFAIHADFRGELQHQGNLNVQTGWLWRSPEQPTFRVRLFAEYYTGRSPYGQFMFRRESFFGGGVALDF